MEKYEPKSFLLSWKKNNPILWLLHPITTPNSKCGLYCYLKQDCYILAEVPTPVNTSCTSLWHLTGKKQYLTPQGEKALKLLKAVFLTKKFHFLPPLCFGINDNYSNRICWDLGRFKMPNKHKDQNCFFLKMVLIRHFDATKCHLQETNLTRYSPSLASSKLVIGWLTFGNYGNVFLDWYEYNGVSAKCELSAQMTGCWKL